MYLAHHELESNVIIVVSVHGHFSDLHIYLLADMFG